MKRIIVYEQHSSASILISRHIRSELGHGSPICIGSFDEEEEGISSTILRILEEVLYRRKEICGSKLSDADAI